MERTVAIVLGILAFLALGTWWLEDRFGSQLSLVILLGVSHLVAFAGGSLLSFAISRGTLRSVNDYAKNDAIIDRYRQQTFKAQASGEAAWQRAAARLLTLDQSNINNLANQRAKAVINLDREQRRAAEETWTWGDDGKEGYDPEGWE